MGTAFETFSIRRLMVSGEPTSSWGTGWPKGMAQVFQNHSMSSNRAWALASVSAQIMIPPQQASLPGLTAWPWASASLRHSDHSSSRNSVLLDMMIGRPL